MTLVEVYSSSVLNAVITVDTVGNIEINVINTNDIYLIKVRKIYKAL
jgi:hypothetical protein